MTRLLFRALCVATFVWLLYMASSCTDPAGWG